MSRKKGFSVFFVLVLSLASVGYSEPGTIMLDFDKSGDVNTEPNFTSFVYPNDNGSEINGITIDITGDVETLRRPVPNTDEGIPIYTEQVYRDFIHGVSPSGVTITLGGLGLNQECDITIYAFDANSSPARLADWTASGDYLLTTDFTGDDIFLWPSPWWGIDYAFGPNTATADEYGTIVLESTRNSSSPEGEDFAFVNAIVVVPKGTYVPPPYAQLPVPPDGGEEIPIDANLDWNKGAYAATHDVYLGTDFNDINDANRSNPLGVLVSENQPGTSYDPPGFLELNKTYYWRIDEVNDPNIWKGKVWSFKTIPHFVIENFNPYENDTALRSVWEGNSGAEVSVETAIAVDGNSMKYAYNNNLPPYYSEASADIADLGIGNQNWLGAQALVLSFYGDTANRVGDKMYVKLTDGDDPSHTGTAVYSDMRNIRVQLWNTWSIALTEFNDVNMANVAGITIGFGDGNPPGSAGTVYFDDIGGSATSISPTSLSIAAAGGSSDTFDIISNTSWTVSNTQYWLTVSPTSSSNNDTVTVTAEQNGSLPRITTLTVAPTGDTPQTVTVTQNGTGGECNIPPLPTFSTLVNNEKFPDPFTFMDGSCVTKDNWECRRAEIAELVQEFELGYKQETPYSATTGDFNSSSNTLTVTVNDNGHQISFNCSISYPTTGSPPYPAMIGCGFSSLNNTALRNLGAAIITYPSDLIAEEIDASSRGNGLFYDIYGSGHSAGALIAWAWGMDRLIDAIEKTPACNIDPNRLGVTGCSRWGKGALICGAFDERIKLTIPQESGSGGAASWRVSQYQRDVLKEGVQWLAEITGENCWFRANFSQFGSAVDKLPFDHHMVAGLCAPRALLIIENTSQIWLGNLSTWTNGNVTHKIYEGLGIPDKMGFSQVGNHNHCAFPPSQQPEVTAYVQKFLIGGGTADTNIMYTDGSFTFDEALWVDWAIPSPIKGDLNRSCRVEFSDLGLFAERWLYEDYEECLYDGWCYEADLNDDGDVDFLDYAELATNWLEED